MFRFFTAFRPLVASPLRKLAKPVFFATGSYYLMQATLTYNNADVQQQQQNFKPSFTYSPQPKDKNTVQKNGQASKNSSKVQIPEPSFRSIVYNSFMNVVRFLHLFAIFMPAILTSPLLYFERTKDWWMDVFVRCIERAGVVWIKAFQYLSHRRDMIGEDLAIKLTHLREHAPVHSWKQTEESFRKGFGQSIEELFDDFNKTPIASGSVGQVYQAIDQGKKVAVKVRHPGVETYIERDVDLLFKISRALSKINSRFQIPVCEASMKRTLTDQIDFSNQAQNLDTFNKMFKYNKTVRFPKAIKDTDAVLVEQFVEGSPVTKFEGQPQKPPINKVIARLGATTFFEMLIKNNFIHADCHGGNIIIDIKERTSSMFDSVSDMLHNLYRYFERQVIKLTFPNKVFRELYLQSKVEEDEVRRIEREQNAKVNVALIDVGMVIKLEETDRRNFVNFLKSIIEQESDECAKMIYSLSINKGQKIIEESGQKYEKYYQDLKQLFSVIKTGTLKEMDGLKLFKDMLDLIREYRMKLDGQFATLLTNMLVLEGLAKDLNPDINILKCAIPYFKLM